MICHLGFEKLFLEKDKNYSFPKIHSLHTNWQKQAGDAVRRAIDNVVLRKQRCSLMLTGGATAKSMYEYWSWLDDFSHDKIAYYFGDERCVPHEHPESNYGAFCRSVFPTGLPQNLDIHPMYIDGSDMNEASTAYQRLLPQMIDILLLGMGEDGHVASIFPGDPVTTEMNRLVIPVIGPKYPMQRLTITPKVITTAETIFLLATGTEKGKLLSRVIREHETPSKLPVMWARGATWLLDEAAWQELNRDFL
jgi:6-phosphogluconolactonase